MELGSVPKKMNEYYSHWGPIFYAFSSARNWAVSMHKGIYIYIYDIHNSLWE